MSQTATTLIIVKAIAMYRNVTLILISFHTVFPATARIDTSGISQFL